MSTKAESIRVAVEGGTATVMPLTEEQRRAIRAVAGRRKGDPSLDRLMEEVERFRETVRQEEIERQDREGREAEK